MNTRCTFDDLAFIKQVIHDMQTDIDFAYGGTVNRLIAERSHPVFQRIASKLEVLRAYANAIKKVNAGNENDDDA